ncbi:MAG: DUF2493 domain-containing protein [Endomicrobium sp.]|jgi:hypothetical protein|nr:DUF2493 domain-containing protein [Endomicrobium sp.]
MLKIIVAGSRTVLDEKKVFLELDKLRSRIGDFTVISGLAKGVDTLGKLWAIKNKLPVEEYPAKWTKYRNSAGIIRNKEMAKIADGLIAFWDGQSKGTKSMIDLMQKRGGLVEIIMCEKTH